MIKDCSASDLVYIVEQFLDWYQYACDPDEEEVQIAVEKYKDFKEYCDQNQIEWDYPKDFGLDNSINKIFSDALSATQAKYDGLTEKERQKYLHGQYLPTDEEFLKEILMPRS